MNLKALEFFLLFMVSLVPGQTSQPITETASEPPQRTLRLCGELVLRRNLTAETQSALRGRRLFFHISQGAGVKKPRTLEDYKPGTLKEILAGDSMLRDRETGLGMDGELLPFRVRVVYTSSALTSILAGQTIAGHQRTKSKPGSTAVSKLNRTRVIGSLGRRLGEVVTIEGIVAEGDFNRVKADAGETLLRVQTVNGKSLKREAIFQFRPFEGAHIKKPPAATRFKYVGYETGGYSGIPDKAFDYVPRVATDGYYFTTSFVILRDSSVK